MAKNKRKNTKKVQHSENKDIQPVARVETVTISNIKEPVQKANPKPSNDDFNAPDPSNTKTGSQDGKIEQATKEFLNPQVIGSVVDSVFISVAKIGGKHWLLEPFERDNLSTALANYLNVVLPEIFKKQPELFALCLTAGVVMLPRVVESVKQAKSRKTKGITIKPGETITGKPATTQENSNPAGNRGNSQESKDGPGPGKKVG